MITRVANLWDRLMSSFWFLPTLMLFAAIVLGVLLPVSENKEWNGGRTASRRLCCPEKLPTPGEYERADEQQP